MRESLGQSMASSERAPREMRIKTRGGQSSSIGRQSIRQEYQKTKAKNVNDIESVQSEALSPVLDKKSAHLQSIDKSSAKVQRPSILKPVIPPKRRSDSNEEREAGYASAGGQIFNQGYISQGAASDADSVRLSQFKNNFNTGNSIRKVSPMAGIGTSPEAIRASRHSGNTQAQLGDSYSLQSEGYHKIRALNQTSNQPVIGQHNNVQDFLKASMKSRGSNRSKGAQMQFAGGSTVISTNIESSNIMKPNHTLRQSRDNTQKWKPGGNSTQKQTNNVKRVNIL